MGGPSGTKPACGASSATDQRMIRDLISHSPHAAYLVDLAGVVVAANRRGAERLGRTEQEIVGTSLRDYFPADVAEARKQRGIEAVTSGREVTFEDRIGDAWYLSTIAPLSDEEGRCTHLAIYGVDITERRRTEEELRRSEAKYRTLFEEASDGIVLTDLESGEIVDCNRAAQQLLGRNRSELVGSRHAALHPPELAQEIERLLASRHVEVELLALTRAGERREVAITASRVTLGDREVLQALYRDITEAKRLEAQLRQAQKMEAIGTLAGGIAHDFNNLLMGIQGNASLLEDEVPPPQREHVRAIEQCVRSGTELTVQLLGFARGGRYEVKPIDLNRLVTRTSKMFGRTRKELSIHHKLQRELWAVEADVGQFEQVLVNLLVNAWQAMPEGGDIFLETRNRTLEEAYVRPFDVPAGAYVQLCVTDTGVGMDAATRQRIFEPFFTTKEMGRGTGLGLATVFGIIKSHGGFISVYSEEGEGTSFKVYLPASAEAAAVPRPRVGRLVGGTETILLVDDEASVLAVATKMLAKLGYEVLVAEDGIEALELYRQQGDRIDAVIIDMIMPGMGGGELFDRLRELDPRIRVMLSSGYSINGEARSIIERGCRAFIQKPYNLKDLSEKLRELLDDEGAGERA